MEIEIHCKNGHVIKHRLNMEKVNDRFLKGFVEAICARDRAFTARVAPNKPSHGIRAFWQRICNQIKI